MSTKEKRIPVTIGKFARELIKKDRLLQVKYSEANSENERELYWYHRGRADSLEEYAELLEKV